MKEYDAFVAYLDAEQKSQAVSYALSLLESEQLDIVTLYTSILMPALNQMQCRLSEKKHCIWKEHVRTAIVRTIVECCYPYILKEQEKATLGSKHTAVVLCPPDEYHDLGARMVADFFSLCGWETTFVGSNTPYQDFYNAADLIRPQIIAISITNYYTLIVSKKIIAELKEKLGDSVKIIVGGYAVRENPHNFASLGADYFADTFEDIRKICKEVL